MKIMIKKGAPVGKIAAPPSKSYGHRMLICAALAAQGSACGETHGTRLGAACEATYGTGYGVGPKDMDAGRSEICGLGKSVGLSEDILATVDCIRALGIGCKISEEQIFIGPSETPKTESGSELPIFPCRESGSTLRFFIPIAMALAGGGVFTGSARLMQRGIDVYEELFSGQVAKLRGGNAFGENPDDEAAFVRIKRKSDRMIIEGRLIAGEMSVRGDVSSQFISGLLYALPLTEGDSVLHVSEPVESRQYIDMTIDAMRSFGVRVEEPVRNTFEIKGGQRYIPGKRTVEGDWSNAAFLYAMKFLHEGSGDAHECSGDIMTGKCMEICGLSYESLQGDKACIQYFHRLNEPISGSIEDADPIDISNCPDLGPVLFAYAAARNGGHFTGVRRLRIKESDRIACMQEELAKFGIKTRSDENEMVIYPGTLRTPSRELEGHNDHRIVMALAVLCTLTGGTIDGAEAVSKSWAGFFDELARLSVETKMIV